jgi:hypothetical protein
MHGAAWAEHPHHGAGFVDEVRARDDLVARHGVDERNGRSERPRGKLEVTGHELPYVWRARIVSNAALTTGQR